MHIEAVPFNVNAWRRAQKIQQDVTASGYNKEHCSLLSNRAQPGIIQANPADLGANQLNSARLPGFNKCACILSTRRTLDLGYVTVGLSGVLSTCRAVVKRFTIGRTICSFFRKNIIKLHSSVTIRVGGASNLSTYKYRVDQYTTTSSIDFITIGLSRGECLSGYEVSELGGVYAY